MELIPWKLQHCPITNQELELELRIRFFLCNQDINLDQSYIRKKIIPFQVFFIFFYFKSLMTYKNWKRILVTLFIFTWSLRKFLCHILLKPSIVNYLLCLNIIVNRRAWQITMKIQYFNISKKAQQGGVYLILISSQKLLQKL